MRQLTLTEREEVRWLEVPEPHIQAEDDALVRPIAVALCDLDQLRLRGEAPIPAPIALGHEFVAEVVSVGLAVSVARPGDRVVVPFQISCGRCRRCASGRTGDCEAVPARSMYGFGGAVGGDWGGALCDLVRVPFADHMLVAAPSGVDSAALASAGDNIPDAWRTVAPGLEEAPGAEVLIVGGGAPSIGLYAVEIAAALGASRVVYRDADERRLGIARELGADAEEGLPGRPLETFPITVDASRSRSGLAFALRSTDPGGSCTSTGILYEPETPVPLLEMFLSGVRFEIGRAMARAAMPAVLDLIATGRVHPERVTTRLADWEDAPAAVLEPETKLVITRGLASSDTGV